MERLCVGSVHLAMQVHPTPAAGEHKAASSCLRACVFFLSTSLFVAGVQHNEVKRILVVSASRQ